MGIISRSVEVNVTAGSISEEIAWLKAGGKANLEITVEGLQQVSQLQSTLTGISESVGSLTQSFTGMFTTIERGATQATAALQKLADVQKSFSGSSPNSTGQPRVSKDETLAKLASRQGVDVSSIESRNSAVLAQLQSIARLQQSIESSPGFQTERHIATESRAVRLEGKIDKTSPAEFFASIIGGNEGRRSVRSKLAEELAAANSGIPGIEARLLERAKTGELSKLFDPRRITTAEGGLQVALGTLAGGGGLRSAFSGGAAALGQGFGGGIGAVLASTASQIVLDPILKAFDDRKASFEEAGAAYSRAILSIETNLQAGSQVVRSNGQVLGPDQIQLQLAVQQKRAEEIQQAARSALLPLGVGGTKEAVIASSTVSALQSRGFQITPDAVAKISGGVTGHILANNPALLEQETILRRDYLDLLSGKGRARKTSLGQILPEDVIKKFESAKSTDDLIKALGQIQYSRDAFLNTENPTALQSKISGAKELIESSGGSAYLNALKPGLKAEGAALSSESQAANAQTFGRLFGDIEATSKRFSAGLSAMASDLLYITNTPLRAFQQSADAVSNSLDKLAGKNVEGLKVERTQAAKYQSIKDEAGLGDALDKYSKTRSPDAQLGTINELLDQFSPQATKAGDLSGLLNLQGSFRKQRSAAIGETFDNSVEGKAGRLKFEIGQGIPTQIDSLEKEIEALSKETGSPEERKDSQGKVEDRKLEIGKLQADRRDRQADYLRSLSTEAIKPVSLADSRQAIAANQFGTTEKDRVSQLNQERSEGIPNQIAAREGALSTIRTLEGAAQSASQVADFKKQELGIEAEIAGLKHKGLEDERAVKELGLQRSQRSLSSISGLVDQKTGIGASQGAGLLNSAIDKVISGKKAIGDALPEELFGLTSQKYLNSEGAAKSFQRDSEGRLAGVNTENFAGRELASSETLSNAQATITANNQLIASYKSLAANTKPGSIESLFFGSRIQELQKDNRASGLTIAKEQNKQELFPAQRSQAQNELNLVLSQSSRLIGEETNKRESLNAQIGLSTEKLGSFQVALDAQKSGEVAKRVSLAKSIIDQGGQVNDIFGAAAQDPALAKELELKANTDRYNAEGAQLGLSPAAFGGIDYNGFIGGGAFGAQASVERTSLQGQLASEKGALADVSGEFGSKAAGNKIKTFELNQQLHGVGNPGSQFGDTAPRLHDQLFQIPVRQDIQADLQTPTLPKSSAVPGLNIRPKGTTAGSADNKEVRAIIDNSQIQAISQQIQQAVQALQQLSQKF